MQPSRIRPLSKSQERREERRASGKKERGAVMVEATIILPLLVLMVLGISEFGFIFRSTITISATSRSAARVSSNVANGRGADFETLNTVVASFGSTSIELEDVEHILIYNATELDTVPPNCFAGGTPQASDVPGRECNHYDAPFLQTLASDPNATSEFELSTDGTPSNTNTSCSTSALDRYFCPLERDRTPNPNTEYVGVWIQVRHGFTTGVLPWSGITLEDKTVMGIEPVGTL